MSNSVPSLGKLERVELRSVWASEPGNFTPWLATTENLQELAGTLGLPPLELVQTEVQTSEYYIDIVARVAGTEEIVVIENQLTRTDHSHLGQALTYAGGTDAAFVIWVAPKFSEGHLAALDWLNRKTTEDVAFFGVEIEAWRIGDSMPAPRFNVVARPNHWAKHARADTHRNSIASNAENTSYWDAFNEVAASYGVRREKLDPVRGSNYYLYLSKRPEIAITAFISRSGKPSVGIYLGLWGADVVPVYERLLADRVSIEADYGTALDWRQTKETVFWVIEFQFSDPSDQNSWAGQHAWIAERMAKMKAVIEPRLSAILDELRNNTD